MMVYITIIKFCDSSFSQSEVKVGEWDSFAPPSPASHLKEKCGSPRIGSYKSFLLQEEAPLLRKSRIPKVNYLRCHQHSIVIEIRLKLLYNLFSVLWVCNSSIDPQDFMILMKQVKKLILV